MKYARLDDDGVIVEIISSDDINNQFHPDFVKTLIEVDSSVKAGWIKAGDGFIEAIVDAVIADPRETMILTSAQARLILAKAGLLLGIIELINAMPDDSELKIMWEYETVFKRLDPYLEGFCKSNLGMNDEMIDELFTGAVVQ